MFSVKLILQIVLNIVLFVTIILVTPGIPPNVNFRSYTTTPSLELVGKLAPNSILNNVKVLTEEVEGPESVALRGEEVFTGDKRGRVIKIKNEKITTVAQFGFACGPEESVYKDGCSWPLALKFDNNGKLVFTDPYYGLIRLDVDTASWEVLQSVNTVIEGQTVKFPEDLDIAKDGTIYWSDACTIATLENVADEMLSSGSGRLIEYNPKTNTSKVLLRDIHFANGVQLSKNEDFVVVAETMRYRLWKYHLKGSKKGQSEIFIDGLPGLPDNIVSNGRGGFYVSLAGPRIEPPMDSQPYIRKFFARLRFLAQYFSSTLHSIIPSEFTKNLHQYARTLGPLLNPLKMPEPRNAFVIELDENGEIIRSLQTTNGAAYFTSQITVGDKYAYLVSPFERKIWYIETSAIRK